jgi:hypothetical protein
MKRISTFRLALWSGVLAEILVCSSVVLLLGYGSYSSSCDFERDGVIRPFILGWHLTLAKIVWEKSAS